MSKVFVGMSGGVDSSVSAALLKEAGHDVTGVFIKVWHPDFLECNWKEERRDAMNVAAALQIPFQTLDLEEEYKKDVVDYMINEYRIGRTPNPDVMCNRSVKFGGFLKYAKEQGADFVATGHYTRNKYSEETQKYEMLEGVDGNKDQSYFLWTLNQDQLKHALFPVGELEKSAVREKAASLGLSTAEKKDSQGLCFIGKVDMKDFLKHYIDEKWGDVVNEDGEVVGNHQGAYFYTIGQRHGFTINEQSTERKPYFIVDKDIEKNTLIVSNNPAQSESSPKQATLEQVNWVDGREPESANYTARIRYRGEKQDCLLSYDNDLARVTFRKAQVGLSRGQSIVIYDGQRCLGGGIVA